MQKHCCDSHFITDELLVDISKTQCVVVGVSLNDFEGFEGPP